MPLIATQPSSWSLDMYRVLSYFVVASSTAVVYDWVLTFGQEYELIWRQRRSLMTALYIIVRYVGLIYSISNMLLNLPGVLTTDMGCRVMNFALLWAIFIVNPMLSVIMITRLHAMYQQSRKMLIFLVVTLISIIITCGVIGGVGSNFTSTKVFLLYGVQCVLEIGGDQQLRVFEVYILATLWQVLTLCLTIWIFVKHVRELRPSSTGQTFIGDCFTVLIKTQVLYFAIFTAGSCLNIGLMSPEILASSSVGAQCYRGILGFATLLQMFVVGPRLVLTVREYHARLVPNLEEGVAGIHSLAFQECIQESTSSDV